MDSWREPQVKTKRVKRTFCIKSKMNLFCMRVAKQRILEEKGITSPEGLDETELSLYRTNCRVVVGLNAAMAR